MVAMIGVGLMGFTLDATYYDTIAGVFS